MLRIVERDEQAKAEVKSSLDEVLAKKRLQVKKEKRGKCAA